MHDIQFDQAEGLRRLGQPRPVKVIAVTGGKGGVGKTIVAVNLGAALAQLGRNAMLLDADLGLANVDVLLGLRTRLNLEHVINGECALTDVIVTASSGLRVVPASSGNLDMASLGRAQHAGLIHAFSELFEPLDMLLIDTAAGLGDGVVTFSEAAHHVVVVVCDEPASITDAYGLIKVLTRRQPGCRIEVVANMVDGPVQGRALYDKLARVSHRFLGITPAYFGCIPYDDYLRRAIRRQSTVVESYPGSPSARAFGRLAAAADKWAAASGMRGGLEFFMERWVRPGLANRQSAAQ
ncbi:MAG TPA: P-loop NTPase [Gammaproteobacteria bacterium]|nr:P-loop NTPase [Gammaproteobacteria bacterium]